MSLKKSTIYILTALLLISFASALSLDTLFQPFANLNIGQFYLNYHDFIDAAIYLLLFLSLAKFIFVKLYDKKEGKAVAIAIGLALTFSMMVFESKTGFYLGKLQAIPAIILLSLLGILLYNLFQTLFNDKHVSFSLTYLILYGVLMSALSTVMIWLEQNSPLLAAILHLTAVTAFIILLLALIGMFGGRKKEENKTETTTNNKEVKPEDKKKKNDKNPQLTIDFPEKRAIPMIFEENAPIPLKISVKDVDIPYMYVAKILNKHEDNVINIAVRGPANKNPFELLNINQQKYSSKNKKLPIGAYYIYVQALDNELQPIINQKTDKEVSDLVEIQINNPTTTLNKEPRVIIESPTHIPIQKFKLNTDIPFRFKIENIAPPYRYWAVALTNQNTQKLIVLPNNTQNITEQKLIKENQTIHLPIGKYRIFVQIINQQNKAIFNSQKQNILDAVEFEIEDTKLSKKKVLKTNISKNEIIIKSPKEKNYEQNTKIEIEFEFKGSDYEKLTSTGNLYYVVQIDGKNHEARRNINTLKNKTPPIDAVSLAKGEHILKITTIDPSKTNNDQIITIKARVFYVI